MLSNAPETRTLGSKLECLHTRLQKLRSLSELSHEFFLTQQFPDLSNHINTLLAQSERDYMALLEALCAAQTSVHYEVSVADAALALGIAENTIRKWDAEGCPDDANYPGRFKAVVFYQWAVSYQSQKRFKREARKRAIAMNTSETSISQK